MDKPTIMPGVPMQELGDEALALVTKAASFNKMPDDPYNEGINAMSASILVVLATCHLDAASPEVPEAQLQAESTTLEMHMRALGHAVGMYLADPELACCMPHLLQRLEFIAQTALVAYRMGTQANAEADTIGPCEGTA